jgi:hypothetical protein
MKTGAHFSDCRKYRYSLWRIWDERKALVMFIGLNPSTANEDSNDATIKRVISIAQNLDFGGVVMCNCFPFISTDPKQLENSGNLELNLMTLVEWSSKVADIVFAWGNFPIVKTEGMEGVLVKKFPGAKALHINLNGSPKHPLYCRKDSQFVDFCTP